MKKRFVIILMLFLVFFSGYSQSPGELTFNITPFLTIPFPITLNGVSDSYHGIGGGGSLKGEYILPFAPSVIAGIEANYSFVPLNTNVTGTETNPFSFISICGSAGVIFEVFPNFILEVKGKPGYFTMLYGGQMGSGLYLGCEADATYRLNRSLSFGIGVSYNNYLDFNFGGIAYHGLGISIGTRISLAGKSDSRLDIKDIRFFPVFPVFYKYYDNNPIGELVINNNGSGNMKNVKVSFYVKQYMDKPKVCGEIDEIGVNKKQPVQLYALFTNNVLDITETTKVMAQIQIEYTENGEKITKELVQSIEIFDRNAMIWDDDRKAASFITAKDPGVLKYAKNIASMIRDMSTGEINSNFRNAMGLFESLALYGINYVKDPSTPYEEFSKNKTARDYLQFPNQTLAYKAGDCDDLSILFCAMLESIGIETGFITIPGHIFMAYSLNMEPYEAKRTFINPGDLITIDGMCWMPVEITMIKEGFLKAWETGAREWRENEGKSKAAFYPVHKSWEIYQPVGFISGNTEVDVPKQDKFKTAYQAVFKKFIDKEMGPRLAELEKKIKETNNDPKFVNKLGLLYARFGFYDKATAEFRKLLTKNEYVPALVNLGNIYFLNKDFKSASEFYERAFNQDKKDPNVLVCLIKVKQELGDSDAVNEYYDNLSKLNPETAEKYAFLVSGSADQSRASDAGLSDSVLWNEE